MRKEPQPWWRMHFEDDPARRPQAHLKAQVDGIARCLQLETRSRVLDLGCGSGQRTLEIARRGHRVLGSDPDERALAGARSSAKAERLNAHFVHADPRTIPYRAEFDAVVCLDGVFGQLASDREDLRMLTAACRALKPGARLLIDTANREWIMRHFEPNLWERGEEGGGVVLDQISFDLEKGRLDNRRVIVAPNGRRTPSFVSVRVYTLTELLVQAEKAGLAFRGCWGGFDGTAYGMDSPRLVALFERRRDERPPRPVDVRLATTIRIKGRR